jgi:RNA polymerase sigma-70 factor (ECF subfamily)
MGKSALATARSGQTARDLLHTFEEARAALIATLYFLLGNYEDAQDAAQEAFLKCWRKAKSLGGIRNLRAWLFRVGLNTAKELQRSAWRRHGRPLGSPEWALHCQQPQASPDEVVVRQEEMERLRAALLDLRPEEKEVFLLRQNGELSYEQIARVVRRPVGTVKTQMRTALQKLRCVLDTAS